jgi:hypothetical protein
VSRTAISTVVINKGFKGVDFDCLSVPFSRTWFCNWCILVKSHVQPSLSSSRVFGSESSPASLCLISGLEGRSEFVFVSSTIEICELRVGISRYASHLGGSSLILAKTDETNRLRGHGLSRGHVTTMLRMVNSTRGVVKLRRYSGSRTGLGRRVSASQGPDGTCSR